MRSFADSPKTRLFDNAKSINIVVWFSAREILAERFANSKDTDQPAHPRRVISAFVIHVLGSIKSKLATNNFLARLFNEETGWSLDLL